MESIIQALVKVKAIKQPLAKAKATFGDEPRRGSSASTQPVANGVQALARVQLDSKHLERHRLISFERKDPSHIAFNVLRTKIKRELKAQDWKTIAVTSPTPRCGKTMVTVNLAFSLAREPECRVVLVDLDLKRPNVARVLGVAGESSIGEYLEGASALNRCFVQVMDNLVVGCGAPTKSYAPELLRDQKLTELLVQLREIMNPDIVLFDLPPMLSGDEAITCLPQVDCGILVVASELTTPAEVEQCELQAGGTPFLGLVLNKCRSPVGNYHYSAYGGY